MKTKKKLITRQEIFWQIKLALFFSTALNITQTIGFPTFLSALDIVGKNGFVQRKVSWKSKATYINVLLRAVYDHFTALGSGLSNHDDDGNKNVTNLHT